VYVKWVENGIRLVFELKESTAISMEAFAESFPFEGIPSPHPTKNI